MILRYEPGEATAVVRRSTIVMLSRTASRDLALRLWDRLPDEAGIVEALESIEAASGTGLRDLPPFAIVAIDGPRVQVAVRGDLTVSVDIAGKDEAERKTIDGADVATWTERVFADVVELAVRADGPRLEGPLVDDTGSWPVFGGIVLADGIAVRPDDVTPAVWSEPSAGARKPAHSLSTDVGDASSDEGPQGGTGPSAPVADLAADVPAAVGAARLGSSSSRAATEPPIGRSRLDESRRAALNGAAHAVLGRMRDDHGSVALADRPEQEPAALVAEPVAAPLGDVGEVLPDVVESSPATAVFSVAEVAAETSTKEAVAVEVAEPAAEAVVVEPVAVEVAEPVTAEIVAEPAAEDRVAAPETAASPAAEVLATAPVPQAAPPAYIDGMWGQTVTDPPVAPRPTEPLAAADPGVDDFDHDGDTVTSATLDKYRMVEPQAPAAEVASVTTGEEVLARICGSGHPNPPERDVCVSCGEPLSDDPRRVKRPPLGRLRFSSGQVIELDRGVIAGRRPRTTRGQGPEMPYLVTVASPQQDISRSHVEVFLDGWKVQVADLATTNGTTLVRAGQSPAQLRPNERVTVGSGDLVDLGDGVTMTFEGLF